MGFALRVVCRSRSLAGLAFFKMVLSSIFQLSVLKVLRFDPQETATWLAPF
jgi:hypothetical protein